MRERPQTGTPRRLALKCTNTRNRARYAYTLPARTDLHPGGVRKVGLWRLRVVQAAVADGATGGADDQTTTVEHRAATVSGR